MKKILGFIIIFLMTACATKHPDLIAEGHVHVVLDKSTSIEYSKVDVHRHDGTTQIEVVVRPTHRERIFTVGSINILETKPDGSQEKIVVDKAHVDRHNIGSTLQHAHFIVFVPRILETGTQLQISYVPSEQK